MTGPEWIAAYAERLGVPVPDDATIECLLALAGVAAHASERTAAPITCYLAGLAGIDLDTADQIARDVAND